MPTTIYTPAEITAVRTHCDAKMAGTHGTPWAKGTCTFPKCGSGDPLMLCGPEIKEGLRIAASGHEGS